MRLFELFDDTNIEVTDDIKNNLMDILTPLVAYQVPSISIQKLIDKLDQTETGIAIDRGLIMTLLDPETNQMIDRIEGDHVYLAAPEDQMRSLSKDDKQKDADHVADMSKSQSTKAVKDGGPL